MPNTTQVGASRIVVMIGSQTTGLTLDSIAAFTSRSVSGLKACHCCPIGVTARPAPPRDFGSVDDGGDHGKQEQPDAHNAQQHPHGSIGFPIGAMILT